MITIQNEFLSVSISEKGAELNNIYHKHHDLEYLWNADPAFWAKKSPVLFPIVGTLKENRYFFDGKEYELGRHGFARESLFSLWEQMDESVSFSLVSDSDTLKKFPFMFQFIVRYTLKENMLEVSYEITNHSETAIYFSVGGHPAFKVPLVDATAYDDYYLEFNVRENAGRWPISTEGLIERQPMPLLDNSNRLALTKSLFSKDALVFKNLSSTQVSLKSDKTLHGLDFDFSGFPYLGIWAAPNANFVCIEPWCGIADSIDSSQQLVEKEGINALEVGNLFIRTWKARFF